MAEAALERPPKEKAGACWWVDKYTSVAFPSSEAPRPGDTGSAGLLTPAGAVDDRSTGGAIARAARAGSQAAAARPTVSLWRGGPAGATHCAVLCCA